MSDNTNDPDVRIGDYLPDEHAILGLVAMIRAIKGDSGYVLSIVPMHDPNHQRVWMLGIGPAAVNATGGKDTLGVIPLAFMHEDMHSLVMGLHSATPEGGGIDLLDTLSDMESDMGDEITGGLDELFGELRRAYEDGRIEKVKRDAEMRRNASNN